MRHQEHSKKEWLYLLLFNEYSKEKKDAELHADLKMEWMEISEKKIVSFSKVELLQLILEA